MKVNAKGTDKTATIYLKIIGEYRLDLVTTAKTANCKINILSSGGTLTQRSIMPAREVERSTSQGLLEKANRLHIFLFSVKILVLFSKNCYFRYNDQVCCRGWYFSIDD